MPLTAIVKALLRVVTAWKDKRESFLREELAL